MSIVSGILVPDDVVRLRVRLIFNFIPSFPRTVDRRMNIPEQALRSTKMYCWMELEVTTGKKPRINPRPRRNVRIIVFLKAAKIRAPWATPLIL